MHWTRAASMLTFSKIFVQLVSQLLYLLSIQQLSKSKLSKHYQNQFYASLKLFKVTCHSRRGHWRHLLKRTGICPSPGRFIYLFFCPNAVDTSIIISVVISDLPIDC